MYTVLLGLKLCNELRTLRPIQLVQESFREFTTIFGYMGTVQSVQVDKSLQNLTQTEGQTTFEAMYKLKNWSVCQREGSNTWPDRN